MKNLQGNKVKKLRALLIVDTENRRWTRIYESSKHILEKEEIEVRVLSVTDINFPRTKRQFIKRTKPEARKQIQEALALNQIQVDDLKLGVKSSALSVRKQDCGLLYKALLRKIRKSSEMVLHRILGELDREDYDLVVISNGRFGYQPALAAHCETRYQVLFLEEKGQDPEFYYFSDVRRHDRVQSQKAMTSEDLGSAKAISNGRKILAIRQSDSSLNPFISAFAKENRDKFGVKKVVVGNTFFTSSSDEFWALGKGWDSGGWINQFVAIEKTVEALKLQGETLFTVRIHPNLANKGHREWLSTVRRLTRIQRKHKEVEVLGPKNEANSYALVKDSQRVFVTNSTVGLEASSFGVPVWCFFSTMYDEVADVRRLTMSEIENESADFHTWHVNKNAALAFLGRSEDFGLVQHVCLQPHKESPPLSDRLRFLVNTNSLYVHILLVRRAERVIFDFCNRALFATLERRTRRRLR